MSSPGTADDQQDLHTRLRELDEEIARLHGEGAALTDQLGGREDGPHDAPEDAAETTNLEENDAIIGILLQRRETLLRQLGED